MASIMEAFLPGIGGMLNMGIHEKCRWPGMLPNRDAMKLKRSVDA
jgi:hypothetical protein